MINLVLCFEMPAPRWKGLSCSSRFLYNGLKEKNCAEPAELLEERRLVKAVGSQPLLGDAEEAQQYLWGCCAHGTGAPSIVSN